MCFPPPHQNKVTLVSFTFLNSKVLAGEWELVLETGNLVIIHTFNQNLLGYLGLDPLSLGLWFYLHKCEVGLSGSRIPGQAAKMERPGFFLFIRWDLATHTSTCSLLLRVSTHLPSCLWSSQSRWSQWLLSFSSQVGSGRGMLLVSKDAGTKRTNFVSWLAKMCQNVQDFLCFSLRGGEIKQRQWLSARGSYWLQSLNGVQGRGRVATCPHLRVSRGISPTHLASNCQAEGISDWT